MWNEAIPVRRLREKKTQTVNIKMNNMWLCSYTRAVKVLTGNGWQARLSVRVYDLRVLADEA
jgi:hypothetical protein